MGIVGVWRAANHNTTITKQSSNRPILGIEALLGLVALKVKFQGIHRISDKEIDKENKGKDKKNKDKDKEGQLCLTEAPPRADNQREVDDLAAITDSESPTPAVADQSTVGTVLDGRIASRNRPTPGGSS